MPASQPRWYPAARQSPAHDAVPAITGQATADRQHDDVDAVERSAPPHHPAGPQYRENNGAQFQSGCRIHGGSPSLQKHRAIMPAAVRAHREVNHVNRRRVVHPNLSLDRCLAFSASISRSRAGACVCSEVSRRRAEAVTSATARSNASALACDGLLKPDSFLTNCSAEAWISSSVAGGSKLNSVLMLRHIFFSSLPARPRGPHWHNQGRSTESKTYIAASFCHRMGTRFTPLLPG